MGCWYTGVADALLASIIVPSPRANSDAATTLILKV